MKTITKTIVRKDIFLGFTAIILLVVGLMGIYRPVTEIEPQQHFNAVFDDVNGLKIGSLVMVSGIPVGKVTGIALREDLKINVAIEVAKNLEISIDSDIRIASSGLFGEPTLSIGIGGDIDLLSDGERFDYSQSSVDFLALFQQLIEFAEAPPPEVPQNETHPEY